MKQIITVIKDGKTNTRLGSDAVSCLKKIKLNRQAPPFTAFTKDVIRKLHAANVRIELME